MNREDAEMIDLHRLECFIKVYEEQNITKASQQLFVTQQGLSGIIKSLEAELGLPLFFRKNNGLKPTQYGIAFYQYAIHISKDIKNARIELNKIKEMSQNVLHIGISNGVFPSMKIDLPITEFQKSYPDIHISISIEADFPCEEKLLSGELDCAFLAGKFDNPKLSTTPLYQEPLYAWIHKSHPLARKKYITLSDIIGEPLILVDGQYNYHAVLTSWCRSRQITPNIRYMSHDPMTIYYLAAINQGIALHPLYWQTMLKPKEELVDLPLADKDFSSWQISLCTYNHPVAPPNQTLFTEFVMQYYVEHPFY